MAATSLIFTSDQTRRSLSRCEEINNTVITAKINFYGISLDFIPHFQCMNTVPCELIELVQADTAWRRIAYSSLPAARSLISPRSAARNS
jgi:hypothetical protein